MRYAARPATAGAAEKSRGSMSLEVNEVYIERCSPKDVPCHKDAPPCRVAHRTVPGADTVNSAANP
jgi:hypothetical protein